MRWVCVVPGPGGGQPRAAGKCHGHCRNAERGRRTQSARDRLVPQVQSPLSQVAVGALVWCRGCLPRQAHAAGRPLTEQLDGAWCSHPHITVLPSHVDVRTQGAYQMLDEGFVGIIVSAFNRVRPALCP